MQKVVKVNDKELPVIEWKGQRVITTAQLADIYETDVENVKKNFERNSDKFSEGEHYFLLKGEELRRFKNLATECPLVDKRTPLLYLWTRRGASRHCKMLGTDKAWEQFDVLEENYYNPRENLLDGISPELKAVLVVDKRVTAVEQKVDHLENTMNIDYAKQKQLKDFANEVVINAIGGKEANAYHYRNEDGSKLSAQVFARFWRDFKDYFNINAYANLPRVRFDEALQYINRWQPPTNMQLEIGKINRMDGVE